MGSNFQEFLFLRKRNLLAACLLALCLLWGCQRKSNTQDGILTLTPAPSQEVVATASATPAPTPTPLPTALPTLPPTPKPLGLLGHKYEELFTEEEVYTDTSYTSPSTVCTWREVYDTETFNKPVTYFVVDIYLQDAELLKTALANNRFRGNSLLELEEISQDVDAVAAISGDFAVWRTTGLVIRNGEVLRSKLDDTRDVGVLYRDGTFVCYEAKHVPKEEILSKNPWQCWCFGPSLLTAEGEIKTKFNSRVTRSNPRAAFGYFEPGHYCFVQVDGRGGSYSKGLTMAELSRLMKSLGCTAAINLDGGATARLSWNHELINQPSDDRLINDILYIGRHVFEE